MVSRIIASVKYRVGLLGKRRANWALLKKQKLLNDLLPNGFYFRKEGFCTCCDSEVVFESKRPWLRAHFRCSNCNSVPRERALMHFIEEYYPNWRNLKIHESSPGKRGASVKLKNQCEIYVASHYFPNKEVGKQINTFRNENLEAQTFEDESFDIVVTQDVMEHVYHPEKAFKEIARTLKKGGAHIFTVPIINYHQPTEVWATLGENGEPVFLKTPEYHGNPVDPKGSPVTMHWGFDIVDFIRDCSGLESDIMYLYDANLGLCGEFLEVIISRKI